MLWRDEGTILAVRRHGESSAVISVFTAAHGRHAGLVRGGLGRRARPVHQIGNRVQATWRARLADQLGTFTLELARPVAAPLLDRPDRLAGLCAACALLEAGLPERDPHPNLYRSLGELIDALLQADGWWVGYVRFELDLLADLGFGLDLGSCAVTGGSEDLAFVSPRTGRAVSRAAAAPYADRLLPLPPFLVGGGPADRAQIRAGLQLTGAFLRRHLFDSCDSTAPHMRQLLLDRLDRLDRSGAS
ncbi:MAG TPA: DNA repair protein RecO [Geminicoccaceae bacterium]|nr:DNA repair protein RecO [Geminicoccaceae bacterium]